MVTWKHSKEQYLRILSDPLCFHYLLPFIANLVWIMVIFLSFYLNGETNIIGYATANLEKLFRILYFLLSNIAYWCPLSGFRLIEFSLISVQNVLVG